MILAFHTILALGAQEKMLFNPGKLRFVHSAERVCLRLVGGDVGHGFNVGCVANAMMMAVW